MRLAQICETQPVQGQQLRIEISEGGFFFHQTADLVQIAGGQRRVLADDMLCHQNPTE